MASLECPLHVEIVTVRVVLLSSFGISSTSMLYNTPPYLNALQCTHEGLPHKLHQVHFIIRQLDQYTHTA
jgi:hypothetical protein